MVEPQRGDGRLELTLPTLDDPPELPRLILTILDARAAELSDTPRVDTPHCITRSPRLLHLEQPKFVAVLLRVACDRDPPPRPARSVNRGGKGLIRRTHVHQNLASHVRQALRNTRESAHV